MYELIFTKKFEKNLNNLEKSQKDLKKKIINYCSNLENNPYSLPYKKLNNEKFRYRLGKYRIFVKINNNKLEIYCLDVKKRKSNTYK